MSTDWSLPTITTAANTTLDDLLLRDVDAATMFYTSPTNQPTHAIRWNRSTKTFQEYDGAAWNDLDVSTGLALGTMAVQNSNAVNISGGTIGTSVSIDATRLTSGTVPLARLSGILNAQIDAAAAIVWTKLSKTGSSLADLTTRSAADLSSGSLADARLSANVPLLDATTQTFTGIHRVGYSQNFNWQAMTRDTIYQATSDGFVIAGISSAIYAQIFSDSSGSPSTQRAIILGQTAGQQNTIMCPVKRSDYWTLNTSLGAGSVLFLYWVPLGISG